MKKEFKFDLQEAGVNAVAAAGGAFVGAAAGKYALLLSVATIAVGSGFGSIPAIAAGAGMMAGVGVQANNLKGLGNTDKKKFGLEVAKDNLKTFTDGLKSSLFLKVEKAADTADKPSGTNGLGNAYDWELMRQLQEQNDQMSLQGSRQPSYDAALLEGIPPMYGIQRTR